MTLRQYPHRIMGEPKRGGPPTNTKRELKLEIEKLLYDLRNTKITIEPDKCIKAQTSKLQNII